ncbi:MAG: hypothetical protein KGL19_07360 [Bacteroidota bacterium]|nr:hypothetical protein [Bacteroidota bacterium]
MKKIIALVTFFVACSCTSLIAQPPYGGGQQMTPEQRTAMMKERYKTLGLNDVQVDSMIAISNDFRPKMMALRNLDQDARQAKMKEITEERNKRIEKTLPADLAKKVIEAMSQQRGGGPRQ